MMAHDMLQNAKKTEKHMKIQSSRGNFCNIDPINCIVLLRMVQFIRKFC